MRTACLFIMVAALAACGSDDTNSSTSSSSSGGAAAAAEVKLTAGNQFTPGSVTIKAGETVKWTWEGGNHNVVSGATCGTPDGKFTSGPVKTSGSFEFKFTTAGTYPYYCDPHCSMGMKGMVVVQ
ncbi:MAG: cupredoxin domain-containing protein [Myxococcales bacterium]|nr:cupredoxin domain-containing protein [Myxococcales bacterium]